MISKQQFKKYSRKAAPYARSFYKKTGMVNPNKKGFVSTSRLIKDVALLKSVINSEKKRINAYQQNIAFGQTNANSSGHWQGEITPQPIQGTGYNQRSGSSVRVHSAYIQMQFRQMSAANSPIRIRIRILKVDISNTTLGPAAIVADAILPNPFCTSASIYDNNTIMDPDSFTKYPIVYDKTITLSADNHSASEMIKNHDIPLKFKNLHTRWSQDSTTIESGRLIMILTTDNGNCSTTTASTVTGCVNLSVNTGVIFSMSSNFYFYDN